MRRALFDLMFGNPMRLRGTAIVLAIALMIFVRPAWHWLVSTGIREANWTLATLITGLWTWIQIGGFIAVFIYILHSVFGGRRGG